MENENFWLGYMDYTGVYGPFEASAKGQRHALQLGTGQVHSIPMAKGEKWIGDGHEMACVFVAPVRWEVAAWIRGAKATHRMMRSAMRKGK